MTRFLATALIAVAAPLAARADGPVAMHYGACPVKLSAAAAARKAVAAMVAEKFPYAEVTEDGCARGWNDKTTVLVFTFPTPNPEQIQVFVFATGTDNAEAERLRNTVRTHIVEGADDPKGPTRVVPAGGKVPPAAVSVCRKSEDRTATPLLKYFAPAAALVMEKLGMDAKPDGGLLVVGGGGPAGVTIVFIAPTANAIGVRFNAVTVTAGPKPAEKLAEDILARVVKMLYE